MLAAKLNFPRLSDKKNLPQWFTLRTRSECLMDDEKEHMDEMDLSTDDISTDDIDLDMDSDMDMGGSWDDMEMDSTVSSSSGSGKGRIILLLLLIVIGAGSATAIAYKMYGGKGASGNRRKSNKLPPAEIPLISEQEAQVIGRERHEMRLEERSDRSSRFTTELPRIHSIVLLPRD